MTVLSSARSVFVTVGSTTFDELIHAVVQNAVVKTLERFNYSELRIQYGKGEAVYKQQLMDLREDTDYVKVDSPTSNGNIIITGFAYTSTEEFDQEILKADLVISHAGAGSILSALTAKKRLIVIPNDSLMDNHQLELADKMQENKYALKGDIGSLVSTIEEAQTFNFEALPQHGGRAFAKVIMEELSKIG